MGARFDEGMEDGGEAAPAPDWRFGRGVIGRRALLLLPLAAAATSFPANEGVASHGKKRSRQRLDQQNEDNNTAGFGTGLNATSRQAQTFTVGLSGRLDRVAVFLGALTSDPDPTSHVVVEIFPTDDAGVPDNSGQPLATGSAPTSAVPNALNGFVAIDLEPAIAVTSGQRLALVLHADVPADFGWFGSAVDQYAGGVSASFSGIGPWFLDSASDYFFKTFVAVKRHRHKHH